MSTPADAAAEGSGDWTTTGSLSTSRVFFSTTLLKSGKVLVAGGLQAEPGQPPEILASAELYDPGTGRWTGTRPVSTARWGHSATLLDTGKVLVVGGKGDTGAPLSTSELFDPASGRWTGTGAMATPRSGHTATLLKTGKVLVLGDSAAEGEIYDPRTGRWSKTKAMPAARGDHTATLLESGKVLVVGGVQDRKAADLEELSAPATAFDPATGEWASVSSGGGRRFGHTAVRLKSDQVLVAGGRTYAGGGGPGAPVDVGGRAVTVELYDVAADAWGLTAPLPFAPVSQEAATLKSGNVLLVGFPAHRPEDPPQVSVQLHDAATRKWSPVPAGAVTVRTFAPSVTVLEDGKVLVTADNKNAYLYTPPRLAGRLWVPVLPGVAAAMLVITAVFLVVRRRSPSSRRPVPAGGGFSPR